MKKLNVRRLAVSLTLGATLALGSVIAWAQTAPVAQPTQAQPAPVAFSAATTQGAITRFVLGPMGRVHAVVLDSGKIVMLGHHGDRAAQSLSIGSRIQVQGYASAQAPNTIMGATVRDASGNVVVQPNPRMLQRFTQQPGAAGAQQPGGWGHHGGRGMHRGHGRHQQGGPGAQGAQGPQGRRAMMQQRMASLPQRNASGTVQTLLVGPRGHIRGVLLQDGTSVTFDRSLSQAATQQRLAVGQTLAVQGRGDQYARGVALFAERVTFANGQSATSTR